MKYVRFLNRPAYLLTTAVLLLFSAPLPAAPQRVTPVVTRHAMVVSSQHLATRAGVRILKEGGNAIDAAVAVGYALAVVHPCCGNIGGGGFMTIRLANGKKAFLNFREKAPAAATRTLFQNEQGEVVPGRSTTSFLAIGIPGTVMGLNTALKKYGTMSLDEVMAPAIDLAENGYVLTKQDARLYAYDQDWFRKRPNAARIFLNDNGETYKAGERLVQKDLAHTLKLIAKEGTKAFYEGPIAREIVKASSAHGGIFTLDDFKNYNAEWRKPIRCTYHGYTIWSAPPPSSGGTTLCEMFQILKPYPMSRWGFRSVNSVHYLVEAMRHAFADRNTYLGDPDFIHNPIDKLLSEKHAAKIRASISPDKATPSSEVKGSLGAHEGMHTTHYSIVDEGGNAVAVTYTVNSFYGSKWIAGNTGFFLNDEMDDFTAKPGVANAAGLVQGSANAIEPGKRPLSSMTPTIVTHNGELFMVTGSPGSGRIITTVLESILNVVTYGMNVKQAVDAPRIHQQWYPDVVYVEKNSLDPYVKQRLEAMGYKFEVRGHWSACEAIVVDGPLLKGANDRSRPAGLAAGY